MLLAVSCRLFFSHFIHLFINLWTTPDLIPVPLSHHTRYVFFSSVSPLCLSLGHRHSHESVLTTDCKNYSHICNSTH